MDEKHNDGDDGSVIEKIGAAKNEIEDARDAIEETLDETDDELSDKINEATDTVLDKVGAGIDSVKDELDVRTAGIRDTVGDTLDKLTSSDRAKKKIPIGMKILAVIFIVAGGLGIPVEAITLVWMGFQAFETPTRILTYVFYFAACGLSLVSCVCYVILGIRLLRNKRHNAGKIVFMLIIFAVASIVLDVMLTGIDYAVAEDLIGIVLLVILLTYLDPSIAQTKQMQSKLAGMDRKARREARAKEPHKGFIPLNFFNLFWVFFICCILGVIIETVYVYATSHVYMDRAGLLFGPFSPIYGCGGVLMTVVLNRFHDKNVILIFLVSAVLGGGFEFLTSWIMQFAFGITAWDYTGTWLSIDGRTNGFYMIMWGLLGVFWIKLLLPLLLRLINLIPWRLQASITTVVAVAMLVNILMTVESLDCWYTRSAGFEQETAIEQFFAIHFDNEWMANRFQTMTMNPDDATRVS